MSYDYHTITQLQILLYEKCKKADKEYEVNNPRKPNITYDGHPNNIYHFFSNLKNNNVKLTDDVIEYIMDDLEKNHTHPNGLYYIYSSQKLNQKAIKKAIEIGESLFSLTKQISSDNFKD